MLKTIKTSHIHTWWHGDMSASHFKRLCVNSFMDGPAARQCKWHCLCDKVVVFNKSQEFGAVMTDNLNFTAGNVWKYYDIGLNNLNLEPQTYAPTFRIMLAPAWLLFFLNLRPRARGQPSYAPPGFCLVTWAREPKNIHHMYCRVFDVKQ